MLSKASTIGLLVLVGCAGELAPAEPADRSAHGSGDDELPSPEAPAESDARHALLSWSFEPASADCNGWPVRGGVGIRAAPPRTGAYSCKICSDGSAPELALVRDVGAVPAGRYALSAWVRQRSSVPAPDAAYVELEAITGSPDGARASSSPIAVHDAWSRVEVALEVDAASSLRLVVGAEAEAERCLFVDDVALVRTQ